MQKKRAPSESSHFILHCMNPNIPATVMSSGGIPWYEMMKLVELQGAAILNGASETLGHIKEYKNHVSNENGKGL